MYQNQTVYGVMAILAIIIGCTTFLVATNDLDADLFMGVVIGPIVGGLIGFVAGTKGVQQGSAASTNPPPAG